MIGLLSIIEHPLYPGRAHAAPQGRGPEQGQEGDAVSIRPVRRPDEDLLILEIRLRSFILSEAMVGYLTPGGLLLPLGDLARALDFPITVEPESGRADGWFLSEDRLFSLDVARREVIVGQRRASYAAAMVELHEDDIFVDTRLLARWFPVDVRFDLPNLSVTIESREPLPVEQRLEREARRGKLLRRRLVDRDAQPRLDIPYRAVSWPFVDTSVEAVFRDDENGVRTASGRYSTLLAGDLAYMSSKLFVTGDDSDRLTDARLDMGRKDPDGGLLGPLGLTEIGLGDVAGPDLPLISRSKFGRGVVLSSFPLDRPTEFDQITIRGELPLGWEAELYRNEVLLDFQQSRSDGRYEFTDVPLLFGLNVLRVELYGPQGQKRQEVRRIFVGPGLVRPEEFHVRIAASQQEQDLLPVENDAVDDKDELEGEARFLAEVERGITKDLSIAAGLSTLPLEDGRRHYGSLSVRSVVGSVYSRFDIVPDSTGGWAGNAAVQTRLAENMSLSVEHGEFRDFVSEQVQDIGDSLRRRSRLRLDGVVAPVSTLRLPFSVTAQLDRNESGRNEAEITNRLSATYAGASVSNDLEANLLRGNGADTTTLTGSFLVGGWLGDVSLRGQAGYDLVPEREFTEASVTGEWFIDTNFSARFGVNRRLSDPPETTYSAGLNRRFDAVSLGLNGDYQDDGNFGARLTMSFALGREPRKGRWRIGSRPIANSGAVSARVFLDNNTNGRFDAEDTPLEGVALKADQGLGDNTTDEEGIAFLTGLSPYRHSTVAVSEGTLEDPYWVPQTRAVSVVPRPGAVAVAEFPIVATGEIDGTVFQRAGTTAQEVADVTIQLLNEDGEIVKTVRSAFDGFYLIDFVPPGRYRVRVDPDQMARLNLMAPPPREVVIGADQDVLSGEDMVITRVSEPARSPTIAEKPEAAEAAASEPPEAPGADEGAPPKAAETAEKPEVAEVAASEPSEAPGAGEGQAAAPATGSDAGYRYWVQVGAYRDRVLGEIAWRQLRKEHATLLGAAGYHIRRVDLGPRKGVFYQFRVGPFAETAEAQRLCNNLKAARVDCFTAKTRVRAGAKAGATRGADAGGPDRIPSFEAVRFLANGEVLVSGVAPPHWDVVILAGKSGTATVGADTDGRWSWVPQRRFAPGLTRLRLLATGPDRRVVASQTDLLVMVPEPQDAGADRPQNREPLALALSRDGNGPTRILHGSGETPGPDRGATALSIDLIEYDTQGNFTIAGRAPAGSSLRILLDSEVAGRATADEDGGWRLALQHRPKPGRKRLAVEHADASGEVIGRAEAVLDFSVSAAPADPPGSIAVQPGDSLWRIARRMYGKGVLYTIIYGVNADQIGDPDVIHPRQKLTTPGGD
ncbi:MAG: SPOR domain-containing protein [Kiloniellaceae bacterium]